MGAKGLMDLGAGRLSPSGPHSPLRESVNDAENIAISEK